MKKPTISYKENDLFRGDQGSSNLNACVGKNGGPYSLLDYARGYSRAGVLLVEQVGKPGNPVDILVYPLTYCFRHSIELYLKYLSERLPLLLNDESVQFNSHKLLGIWAFVKNHLQRLENHLEGGELLDKVEKILIDFVEFDSNGEVFRFPSDRRGNEFLQDSSLINVGVLRDAMVELSDVLDWWCWMANDLYQAMSEERVMHDPESLI